MEKVDRSIKDKRYEEKHKAERKAKCMVLGNERAAGESRANKRVFEKIRLYKGATDRSGIQCVIGRCCRA